MKHEGKLALAVGSTKVVVRMLEEVVDEIANLVDQVFLRLLIRGAPPVKGELWQPNAHVPFSEQDLRVEVVDAKQLGQFVEPDEQAQVASAPLHKDWGV